MNANELRIGNYILSSGNIAKVDYIDKDEIGSDFIDSLLNYEHSDIKYISPIPLKEEWLVKFGWVWNEETKSFEKYPNGDARMHLQFREVSNSYTMFNYVLKSMIAERIWYVHQLQNLYFALKGEELKLLPVKRS